MVTMPIKTTKVTLAPSPNSSASTISITGAGGGGVITNPVLMGGTVIGPSNGSGSWTQTTTPGKIHVQGDAVFDGNITWQGRDMREWFASVESRLGMLRPNPELEQGWDELAQLRQQYIELEKKLLEQQRVFDILKKT
jgi:hypothetical protein